MQYNIFNYLVYSLISIHFSMQNKGFYSDVLRCVLLW